MKRIRVLLASLALFGVLPAWPLSAFAQSGAGFSVFDGLAYKNKPDLSQFGLRKIHIAYTSELWGGSQDRDQPNEAAVKNVARSADPNIPLVLDIEHWKILGSPEAETSIDKLIQIAAWVHETNPNVKMGFYGLMPISDSWLELHYALAKQGLTANVAAMAKAYEKLRQTDGQMRRLAEHVDFVCPVLYTFNTLGGGEAEYQKSWDIATTDALQKAAQYNKPVYAFVWPQFYDAKGANGDNEFIPASFWGHELELIRGNHAQGAIIWGSSTYRKSGWNDNDPWWQATKEFVSAPH